MDSRHFPQTLVVIPSGSGSSYPFSCIELTSNDGRPWRPLFCEWQLGLWQWESRSKEPGRCLDRLTGTCNVPSTGSAVTSPCTEMGDESSGLTSQRGCDLRPSTVENARVVQGNARACCRTFPVVKQVLRVVDTRKYDGFSESMISFK